MSETACDYAKFRVTYNHPEIGKGKLIVARPETVKIGGLVAFDLTRDVKIGDWCEISPEVKIFTHRHHWNHSRGPRRETQRITSQILEIGEDAFIGTGAIILGIAMIGKGAIIGAGSVVTRDVPEFEVWAGNPARKIGERSSGAL